MPSGGKNAKPSLQIVREGNPGKRPLKDSVKLPPTPLVEPKWSELLPGRADTRTRATAASMWKKLAPTLTRSAGLVGEQQEVLVDLCISWARIEQGERALSQEGATVRGMNGGTVKNPWTTVLTQYRAHFRSLVAELGLSPSSAARITRPGGDSGDDDPFDD